jgi:hypothetical protein
MFRKIALALLIAAFVPVSDGMAQDKSKGAKKGQSREACIAAARANCPPYGVNARTCVQQGIARCRQGGQ